MFSRAATGPSQDRHGTFTGPPEAQLYQFSNEISRQGSAGHPPGVRGRVKFGYPKNEANYLSFGEVGLPFPARTYPNIQFNPNSLNLHIIPININNSTQHNLRQVRNNFIKKTNETNGTNGEKFPKPSS